MNQTSPKAMRPNILKKVSVICIALLLTACAGAPTVKLDPTSKQSIQSASIKTEVAMPADMFYQGPAQSIGMGVGGLIGYAITQNMTSDKDAVKATLTAHNINVGQLVASEFANELRSAGKIPLAEGSNAGNAEFKLEVVVFGIGQTQGFASTLYPTLGVNGTLTSKEGKVLWQRYEYVTPLNKENTIGAEPAAYVKDPELLRSAFKKAAGIVSRMLIETL
ncbi:MAG: hypothetical protein C0487_18255 [Leptothrix sp. (in: Bacteria)]|nr:hypothetical protein [Leptothrix sp. (in: b-proteobacteria)]